MIKNFKNKFLICLFLLVTVFSVTSSCFASDIPTTFKFYPAINNPSNYTEHTLPSLPSISTDYVIIQSTDTINTIQSQKFGSSSYYVLLLCSNNITFYANSSYRNTSALHVSGGTYYYLNSSTNKWVSSGSISGVASFANFYEYKNSNNNSRMIYSSKDIYAEDDSSFCLWCNVPPLSVDVIHEFQSDTSAKVNFTVNNAPDGAILKYSLTGVEISTDLTAPIQLRNPVTYTLRNNKFSC